MESMAQFSVAISPILAVVLAYFLNKYSEKRIRNETITTEIRKEKMEILKSLMSGRIVSDWKYFQSLNIIEIIFADNQNVRNAWKELYSLYKEPKSNPEEQCAQEEKKHLKLIESIVIDLGYKEKITWEHLSEKYNPVFISRQVEAQYAYNNILTKISKALDGQNATPMIDAINKISESINSIMAFLNSIKNYKQDAPENNEIEK